MFRYGETGQKETPLDQMTSKGQTNRIPILLIGLGQL